MKEVTVAQLPTVCDGVPTRMWRSKCLQINYLTVPQGTKGGQHVHPPVSWVQRLIWMVWPTWYKSKDPETLIVASGWVRLICWGNEPVHVHDLRADDGAVGVHIPLGVAHLTICMSETAVMSEPYVKPYCKKNDRTIKISDGQLPPRVKLAIQIAKAEILRKRYPWLASGRLRMPVDEGGCGGSPPVYISVAGP